MALPVMLKVENRRCLVVGGGKVGIHKARTLLDAGAKVIILSPQLAESLPEVEHIAESYSLEQLLAIAPWMVIAATNDVYINHLIYQDAEEAGILTLIADDPAQGDIQGLMHRDYDGIVLAIATGNPHLSRHLLMLLSESFTPELLTFANWLQIVRSHIKENLVRQSDRADLWQEIFESPILEQIEAHNLRAARVTLERVIGPELAQYLPALGANPA